MKNLLAETINCLTVRMKSVEDVRWVGDHTRYFTWDEYAELANREYDDDFGLPEVLKLLKVVGDDWWLERHEYDGREWWEFKKLPLKPEKRFVPSSVFVRDFDNAAVYVSCEAALAELENIDNIVLKRGN